MLELMVDISRSLSRTRACRADILLWTRESWERALALWLALAFIWLDDRLYDTAEVEQRVASLMERLAEKVTGSQR